MHFTQLVQYVQYVQAFLLYISVHAMEERDRLCCLSLDEMETKKVVEYDPSNQQVIGDVTLAGSSGEANHALVSMLGGKEKCSAVQKFLCHT